MLYGANLVHFERPSLAVSASVVHFTVCLDSLMCFFWKNEMLSCVINNCLCTDKTNFWSIEMLCTMRLDANPTIILYTAQPHADGC